MILTGDAIHDAIVDGDITFSPFELDAINPNSINYRLGHRILQVSANSDGDFAAGCEELMLEENKFLLRKGCLYLGSTLETIGSDKYVTSLIGRSSVGRLGLFVQVSANLGHVGAIHQWTLELVPSIDIYVYPGQTIGQVSFWQCAGDQQRYDGWFGQHNQPMLSKHHDPFFLAGE